MRKIFFTYAPASMLLALLAMVLLTCGGGGGSDGGSSRGDLTGLSISGPLSMSEYGTATYAATATWSDNSTTTVTATWSVNLQTASISTSGVLSCVGIDNNQTVTVTASYTSGGLTETDTMDVSVTDVATIPFTAQMVSGQAFFEENFPAGGGYESTLSLLNADFTFDQYSYEGPPPPDTPTGTSDFATGTWSIDASGNLVIIIGGQGTITVGLISDSSTMMQAVVADGTEPPPMVTLEKIVPVDPSLLLPGTYDGSDGFTWVFNADGTGTAAGFTFSSSVDSEGVLRMPFNTGYTGSVYARATSQSTATEYTILRMAFTEHNTATGNFYFYYGGIELTRQ